MDGRWVFRFPRRRIAVALIEREMDLLPLLAPHLPLPISAARYRGKATAGYPAGFGGYERIAGTTACSLSLDAEERAALAQPLGAFLRVLHAIDPAPLVACGLPPDTIGRLDHHKRLAVTRERLPSLRAAGFAEGLDVLVAWLEAHPPQAARRLAVVHGDLYGRHVLLDERRQPCGIIDWGDMHLGDPGLDLAIAHLMLPPQAHALFRRAYGTIDERTWQVARYRAIYHAVLELDYGLRANDPGMRDGGAAAIARMGEG